MIMDKATLLMLYCLLMSTSCATLYPSLRSFNVPPPPVSDKLDTALNKNKTGYPQMVDQSDEFDVSLSMQKVPGEKSQKRFDQRALASFLLSVSAMLPNQLPHSQAAEHRPSRHADAIFTNSYRKVLGQISARKFLQAVMGKRFGVAEARDNVKRQSDIYKDTYKRDLITILNEEKIRRWQQDVTRHSCSGSTCGRSETAFFSPGGRRGGASDIDH